MNDVDLLKQDPNKIMPIQVISDVTVQTENNAGKPLTAHFKRGFNTLMDFNSGELIDPAQFVGTQVRP